VSTVEGWDLAPCKKQKGIRQEAAATTAKATLLPGEEGEHYLRAGRRNSSGEKV